MRQSDFISSCWQEFTGTVEVDEAGKEGMPPWYRCRYDHGHDKGWELVNIITGMVVCL